MANINSMNVGGQLSMIEDTAARDMEANAYDSTQTYAKEDICVYNNKLYEANTAITTPEVFNIAHWVETTLGKIAQKHGDSITQLTENSAYTPLTLLGTVDGIKLYYSRYGKNVMVKGEGNFSKAETITSSAQLKLGTLPVGIRPSTTLFYSLNYLYTNATNLALMLTNTGEVSICTTSGDISITNGKYFNFAVGFIL